MKKCSTFMFVLLWPLGTRTRRCRSVTLEKLRWKFWVTFNILASSWLKFPRKIMIIGQSWKLISFHMKFSKTRFPSRTFHISHYNIYFCCNSRISFYFTSSLTLYLLLLQDIDADDAFKLLEKVFLKIQFPFCSQDFFYNLLTNVVEKLRN